MSHHVSWRPHGELRPLHADQSGLLTQKIVTAETSTHLREDLFELTTPINHRVIQMFVRVREMAMGYPL